MQKLDRLGWAGGISFVSCGLRIGIRVNHAVPLPEISRYLPVRSRKLPAAAPVEHLYSFLISDSAPGARVRKFNLIYRNTSLVGRHPEYDAALELFASDLQRFVAESSTTEIFVHAGVVGWKGKAIIIPGSSQSGKSTLTAALVRAGATYYSDEYAVLNSDGRVLAYPVALSLREDGEVRKLDSSVLGTPGRSPLPIGAVIQTRFETGKKWKPKALSPGLGILGMLANTVQAQTRAADVLQRLKRAASCCTFLCGPRGEAGETAEKLLSRLEAVFAPTAIKVN